MSYWADDVDTIKTKLKQMIDGGENFIPESEERTNWMNLATTRKSEIDAFTTSDELKAWYQSTFGGADNLG